jgi:two-component system, sensor histidine kinase and response regulator
LDSEQSSLSFSPYELIHPKELAISKKIFDNAVKENGSFDTYTKINTPPNNQEKTLHIKGKVIYKDGKPFQLIGTTQDVTVLMQTEQELRKNNKELTEAQEIIAMFNEELKFAYGRLQEFNIELETMNKSKDKFISVISHDLRSPVSSIIASSEILFKNYENLQKDEAINFSRIINISSTKILEQFNELVERSKQKTKQINFNPQTLNLNDFIVFSLELIQTTADKKNIRISNLIETHLQVKADPLLLRSIIQNLITNSIKFTPEGGEIIIEAFKESNSQLKISIEDNGIGMSEEMRDGLFCDEATIEKTGAKTGNTKGLGLVLVKDFVEKHQGKIWVESESGEGSTFYFTLPVEH